MHTCPMVTGVVPHVGGPILPPCQVNVLTGMLPQARITDMAMCAGPPDVIIQGAFTVLVGGLPAARLGDMTAHGGVIVMGCFTVLIGDAAVAGGGLSAETIAALQARNEAIKMLDAAIDDLNKYEPKTKARAKLWFGSDSEATRKKMLDRAKKARDHLAKMKASNFVDAEPGEEDCFAYVYPNDDTKMYLGKDFKTAPLTGADSKAGTLIHESSHYNSVAGTNDEKLANGTTAYGHSNAKKLAKEDPSKAQNNADSWEYFVENK